MSIRYMTRVWDDSRLDGPRLLMMLALADHANDDGVCWPSKQALQKRTRKSQTRVYALIKELKEAGYITAALSDDSHFQIHIPENGIPENGKTDSRKRENPQTPLKEEPSKRTPIAPKARERNPIWDAVCLAIYHDADVKLTKSEAGDVGKTVSELTQTGATPDDIAGFPRWWGETFPGAALTHRCLRLHFRRYMTNRQPAQHRQLWQGDSRC